MNDVIKFPETCESCGTHEQVFGNQCDLCFNEDRRWRGARGAGLIGIVRGHAWAVSTEMAPLIFGDAEGLTRLKFTIEVPGVEEYQTVERYVRGTEAAHALGVHMLNGGFGIDYGSFKEALGFDGIGTMLEESAQQDLAAT